MKSLTSPEKTAIRKIIEFGKDTYGFDTGRVLPMTLVLLGDRDGCLFAVTNLNEADFLEGQLTTAEVPFLQSESSGIYRFFIAKSPSHLRSNPPGEGRASGFFFGYPEDAIDFYCSSSDPLGEFEKFMLNKASGSFQSWESKTPLIEYIPAPSEDSIEETLRREKQYEDALKSAQVQISDAHRYNF